MWALQITDVYLQEAISEKPELQKNGFLFASIADEGPAHWGMELLIWLPASSPSGFISAQRFHVKVLCRFFLGTFIVYFMPSYQFHAFEIIPGSLKYFHFIKEISFYNTEQCFPNIVVPGSTF